MEKMNLPPFYVGQEVVAIYSHSEGDFKKGQEFKVTEISKSCCNGWDIGIGKPYEYVITECSKCGKLYNERYGEPLYDSDRFAPKQSFQPITFEKITEQEPVCVN